MTKLKELINLILELDSKDLTIGDNQDPPGISQMCAQLDKENFYYNSAPRLAKACEVLIKALQNSLQSWNEVCELSDCAGGAIVGIDKALAEVEALLKEEK